MLAVLGVGHLERHRPAMLLEPSSHHRDRRGMIFVEEPLELRAAPARRQAEPRIEGKENRPQPLHGEFGDMAALDSRDQRLRGL